jgi:predicted enzyme related to lactoylglutathione lyase
MKMNPVVLFEMLAKDRGRMKKFYETAFGWQMEQLGKGLADDDWRNDEKWHP